MAMIQAESPCFQPVPQAPALFTATLCPNDLTFTSFIGGSDRSAISWAVCLIDSASIYVLGAGIYSWFGGYSQDGVDTEDCQECGLEIEQSHREDGFAMGSTPMYARDKVDGLLSSVLAWLQGPTTDAVGEREFPGYTTWFDGMLDRLYGLILPDTRRNGLTENTDTICAAGFHVNYALPTLLGGRIWSGWNQTCLLGLLMGKYSSEVIGFSQNIMMQRSQFSSYDTFIKSQLEYTLDQYPAGGNFTITDSPIDLPDPTI
ncbi:hypothetical protein VE03_04882 [Pseudogymnoascus sp. 23342-1-I1]|nr:hypothetical protein VE03_04882 [Pseudogymnoascus sp. 23342-1-I1]